MLDFIQKMLISNFKEVHMESDRMQLWEASKLLVTPLDLNLPLPPNHEYKTPRKFLVI